MQQPQYAMNDDLENLQKLSRWRNISADPDYQRMRKVLQNQAAGSLGGMNHDEYAAQIHNMDGTARMALQAEFEPMLGSDFFENAYKREHIDNTRGAGWLNRFNSGLSDFASLDRDNEGWGMKAIRGLANIPLWASQGLQATGEGTADLIQDAGEATGLMDPAQNVSERDVGDRLLDSTGVLGGGMVKGLGKSGYNLARNPVKSFTNLGQGGIKKIPGNVGNAITNNKAALTGLGGTAVATNLDNDDNQVEAALANNFGPGGPAQDGGGVTLDDPIQKLPGAPMTGAGAGAGAGGRHPATAFQERANSRPQFINRKGGSGSKMVDLSQARTQAEADRLMDIEIQKSKGTYDPTYSEDPDYFMKKRYESTGGRAAGEWDALTPEQKRQMTRNYQANSSYNSASPEGRAADKRLADSGYVAPRHDGIVNAARAELGMPSLQQNRLDELDKRAGLSGPVGATGPEGPAGSQAPAQWGGGNVFVDPNDPTNENKRPGQVSRNEFMDKSGMRTPGTGLTQNPDGTHNTLEFGDTFEKSGGDKSAEEYLVGPQGSSPQIEGGHAKLANLQHQANDQSVTMADGHSNPLDDLSKGTRRLSSDMQDYGDAAFQNKSDALGYLNRQAPTMEDPAPAPAPEPEPEPEDEGMDWKAPLGGLGLGSALLYGASRGKLKSLPAQKLLGNKPQKLLGNSRNQKLLGNSRNQKLLGNKPQKLSENNKSPAPKQLGNKPAPKQLPHGERRGAGLGKARHQPSQGPGGTQFTKKSADHIYRSGLMPDGSVATKAQRIAAMRYLRENRL